jgi:hypothetical protein
MAQLSVSAVLVAQGELEEACRLAHEVLDSMEVLASAPVLAQLEGLESDLIPYGDNVAGVGELRERLRNGWGGRRWFMAGSTSGFDIWGREW